MLNQLQEPVKNELSLLETSLPETLSSFSDYQPLIDIIKHATQSPGKWLRSILCFYFSRMSTNQNLALVDTSVLLYAAQTIESIHLASLIHDDIFDNALYRRNVEAVYKKFGLNTGVLSGVYVYSLALQLMSNLKDTDIVSNLSSTVSQLCEGEFRQLQQRHCWDMSLSEYTRIVEQKTASLFSSACYMGAKVAGAGDSDLALASQFGLDFGCLFQLIDDCKDFFDTQNHLKKEPFQDLVMGDVSYPLLLIKSM